MPEPVRYHMADGVAVLTISNPPVNALSHAVRARLASLAERAAIDGNVRAIVIAAEGRTFPAGADISEFGKPPSAPWLPEVCARIEAIEKPVVAAIHGTALGGGFEVALAAHARIADPKAAVGLPEVKLGILPGAGGTQRAPRLCGAGPALDLMLSGEPIHARAAERLGLVDVIAKSDLLKEAIAFARKLADADMPPLRSADRAPQEADPAAWAAEIAKRREALKGTPLHAPPRIVDCVEAVQLLPFEAGLDFERAAFEDLVGTAQSAALRHAFFAERRAGKLPELKGVPPREVADVGVIGAGLMGSGIAVACLNAGHRVTLIEKNIETLEAGVERIIDIYDRQVARRKMSVDDRDARIGNLAGREDLDAVAEADLVIEAVVEDMDIKQRVFASLGRITAPGTVLATNTSYLDIDEIARGSGRPEDVIGLHFFSPAQVMRLVEVIPGRETAANVLATGFEFAGTLGKIAVRAGVTDGFIGNRVLAAYRQAAELTLLDGAAPEEIDAAMRAFGFPLGPFQVSDLAGLDIAWARRKRLAATRDPAARYVSIPDRLCEMGRLGRKAGFGWYAYPKDGDRLGEVDPAVAAVVDEERIFQGVSPRKFSGGEIQRRCLVAMANEGAKLLAEGIARRPSDIDVVMMHGFAFPRWHGGPMMWADQRGLLQVQKDLRRLAEDDPAFWAPAPVFGELIKNGRGFDSLNG